MNCYKVFTYGGEHTFPERKFCILYHVQDKKCVWQQTDDNERVFISLLNCPSGSGKSTFLAEFYRYLQGSHTAVRFAFQPDHVRLERCSYGYIPQQPPFANHWRIAALLPQDPVFLRVFFPDTKGHTYLSRRLGQFSGGQKLKLYVCSAIERLLIEGDDASFLLLDEVFDGLGAGEAQRCIKALRAKWREVSNKTLYVLLVSHLDKHQIVSDDIAVTRIRFSVEQERYEKLVVRIEND